jgi:hypothetical protein
LESVWNELYIHILVKNLDAEVLIVLIGELVNHQVAPPMRQRLKRNMGEYLTGEGLALVQASFHPACLLQRPAGIPHI